MKETTTALRSLMFVGTASDVGKSIITAGFCRILKQDGYHPAPFKGQNMSLNSYATPEGFEIGRAQAVQAEAAGVPCHTDMNPVLLKPVNDKSSQVVLNGKPVGTQTAWEYFMANDRQELFAEVTKAYDRLAARYAPIVLEGAGSISELNLKQRDITNMRMAIHANATTYLIGDIDRGGIFASLYGTMSLLTPPERACIKGIIINKFRGDSRLFEDGRKMIEELCGVPVIGVLPYFRDIFIEEEDSVQLQNKQRTSVKDKINVAVILLHRLSNFTDFDRLEKDPRVNLFYTIDPAEIANSEIIILPGSKNTIEDLIALKNNGVAGAVTAAHKNGKTVIGICGGYQMMGELIEDPFEVESKTGTVTGLGLLPLHTVLGKEKTTLQRHFTYRQSAATCTGYEIHMGQTAVTSAGLEPVLTFSDGTTDGCYGSKTCWGTYVHGILDNDAVINDLLATDDATTFNYRQFKEEQYDKLAMLIREHVDMDQVYQNMKS
ncbi:cobyric acid synthase CobQ [Niastella vici]|uniref:Cobyric acid synthase n=1 Tax=Niastella vici TaxID=1703345 RepID=A0A1V9FWA7_9BACT|nr:cobyric acid synthase [Niastella vici]OQP62632.1 cobyric acid synthase CobQ [Niastella vici]